MLQAHSLLWHYLWVAPSVLLLLLASQIHRLSLHKRYPVFFAYVIVSAIEQLTLYVCDIIPAVPGETWWRIFWIGLLIEGLLKFALVGEIFAHVFDAYASIASLGKLLIRGIGVSLILAAAVAAACAPKDSPFQIVSSAHLLEQTIYLVQSGLLLFIFAFSAYCRIRMTRAVHGIALGLAISGCVHLANWALVTNVGPTESKRIILDFINMATYHFCVLIWFFYLLVPHKVSSRSAVVLPEHNLEVWNREMERLLHR
jgi:hypothetical protein